MLAIMLSHAQILKKEKIIMKNLKNEQKLLCSQGWNGLNWLGKIIKTDVKRELGIFGIFDFVQ